VSDLKITSLKPDAPKLSKGQVFIRRLASTVALWTVVVLAIFSSNPLVREKVFVVLLMFLATAGLLEFYNLVERRGLVCYRTWGLIHGLMLIGGTFVYLTIYAPRFGYGSLPSKVNDFESSVLVVFVLGLCVRLFFSHRAGSTPPAAPMSSETNPASPGSLAELKPLSSSGLLAISATLFGLFYVPWLLNFIQKIALYPEFDGRFYVLYFILVTKFSDLGAYSVGSMIGRHKMIPRISPGKTWEGFFGAIVVSTGASVAFAHFAGDRLPGMNWVHAVILGILLSVAAVVGDLIESLFKREAGVKDSGKLFPGIGGILDLLDSLLFNAPLMYLYLRHVLTR
jgi:phosphatidate cytidylyltransferase